VHLLAYADRLGGDLAALRELLTEGPLAVFSGVHILPFFTPHDGVDAGFDPVDHTAVDPRLGSWSDIRALREAGLDVTADLIVNHVSADSAEFRDWLARGAESRFDGMFLTFDSVFPHGATEELVTAFHRPRAGLPFTPYELADGTRRLVWTTFMPSQVDLDVAHPKARDYLSRVLRTLAAGGVRTVRLDAVGYAVKTAGTDSFMTDATIDFVREVTALAHAAGLEVLVEVHAHHSQQLRVAGATDLVYDFALPPLLLQALETGAVDRLLEWLRIRPDNVVTVLDTHDGIGVVDAGPAREWPGLMDHDEMRAVFEAASSRTRGQSDEASTRPAWAALPHQVNSTFYSVLGEDDDAYLLARAFQLLVPGRPQVYYVGLLAGRNDRELFQQTGAGREINRHRYSRTEIDEALERDVVRRQLELIRLRGAHPAFAGSFSCSPGGEGVLVLAWTKGAQRVELRADFRRRAFEVTATDPQGTVTASPC
jgi:sucrose phosphorylase